MMPPRRAKTILDSSASYVETEGNELIKTMKDMVNGMLHVAQNQQLTPRSSIVTNKAPLMVLLHEFKHQNPPSFKGDPDPTVAEDWLAQIKKMLDILDITDDEIRVKLATYQLNGEADQWWQMVSRSRDVKNISWDEFCTEFLNKYFPHVLREIKLKEFLNLSQGYMSVMEYQARFNELHRFVSHIFQDEAMKARQFEKGLKPSIRDRISILKMATYAEVVERALVAEANINNSKRQCDESLQRYLLRLENPNKKRKTVSISFPWKQKNKSNQGQGQSSDHSEKNSPNKEAFQDVVGLIENPRPNSSEPDEAHLPLDPNKESDQNKPKPLPQQPKKTQCQVFAVNIYESCPRSQEIINVTF